VEENGWELGPWGPQGAIEGTRKLAQRAVRSSGRQRLVWRVLAVVVLLALLLPLVLGTVSVILQ